MEPTNSNAPQVAIVPAFAPLNVRELIDKCALARRLGVSRSTLQSWRYGARGPRYFKIGRLVRYRNADVEAFLEASARGDAA